MTLEDLAAGIAAGERRSIARGLRLVDDSPAQGRRLAASLHRQVGHAQVIGITGNPGSGKSTVCDALVTLLRARSVKVAVLAVDPTSPFSGGAVLGDRIRMTRHAADDGVFIRSLATRGALGGLSRAAFDSTRLLDAAGFEVILIETVGVGQDEIDVARLAQTTVVVLVPGLGDDVQMIKAGILEVADLFLINKADREGVPELERSLRQLLSLARADGWRPPVITGVASQGQGMSELLAAIGEHHAFLRGPEGSARVARQGGELFERLLDAALIEEGRARLGERLVAARRRLREMHADPYDEVAQLVDGGRAP